MFFEDAIAVLTNDTYHLLSDVRDAMAVIKKIAEVFI